tara:strand:+ start:2174 stop:2440 length:267 start_codon:yes stop_codon:yes gene_type:complete
MNKNKWGYEYNFITYEDNKDLTGIKLKLVNSITFTTNLGKDYADQLAKGYVENYQYPKRVVDIYYSLTNNRYMPSIYYVGKTKESVGK